MLLALQYTYIYIYNYIQLLLVYYVETGNSQAASNHMVVQVHSPARITGIHHTSSSLLLDISIDTLAMYQTIVSGI